MKEGNNIWSHVRNLFRPYTPSFQGLTTKTEIIRDNQKIANRLAKYYKKHFSEPEYDNKNLFHIECIEAYKRIEETASIALGQIKFDEVRMYWQNLKAKKSLDSTDTSALLLKNLPHEYLNIITTLFNKCAEAGEFFEKGKIAKGICLSKEGSFPNENRLRSISLLPNLAKIFEKIIAERIEKWCKEQGVYVDEQSGFTESRRLQTRIVAMMEDLKLTIAASNRPALTIFVDFATAFDRMWYPALMKSLEKLDMPLELRKWVFNWLQNRKMYISHGDAKSRIFNISVGAPQGSVLAALLFRLHVFFLPSYFPQITCHLFADDLTMTINGAIERKLTDNLIYVQDQAKVAEFQVSINQPARAVISIKTKFTLTSKKNDVNKIVDQVVSICGQIQFASNDRVSEYIQCQFDAQISNEVISNGVSGDNQRISSSQIPEFPIEINAQQPRPTLLRHHSLNEKDKSAVENKQATHNQLAVQNTNIHIHDFLDSAKPSTNRMREDNDDSSENLNETDDEIAESEKEVEESQATKIVNFIRNKWKLPVPELIISITGGAQHFKFASPRVRNAFQKGLISAAMNTDAWIFTAGTHSGIIKEVGDAFDKCRYKNANAFLKLPCIGICSWFATTDYKQLESPSTYSEEDKSKISEQPNTIDKVNIEKSSERSEQNVRLYRVRQPPEKGEPESYPLDHNHTHFIILQDEFGEGDRKWKSKFKENVRADLILPIRAQIEQESRTIKRQGQKYKIPIVQILVDGGVSSILTVCESIAAGTPVIVIAGSGRAADLIANEYRFLYKQKIRSKECYEKILNDKETFQKFNKKKMFGQNSTETIITDTNREEFIKTMTSEKGYFLLNILELDVRRWELKFDDAILEAQLNAALMTDSEQRQKSKKLVLAMAWKKYDLVAHDVIKNLMESDNAELHLDEPLWEALRRNSVNFVELLIGYGASFERLRRLINTSDLYKDLNDNSSGSSLHLPDITQQVQPSNHTPGNVKSNCYSKYYKYYLNEDSEPHPEHTAATDNYGIISHPRKEDSFLHGMVFFNANDIIRESGHVTELSINFANLAASESLPEIVLYILSSTNDKNKFLIIYRRAKQYLQITKIIVENDIRTLIIQEPTLFLQTGQYLAIGFRNTISRPFQVKGSDSYYIDFHAVDAGLDSGRPTLFVRQAIYGLAFCFKITPATGFIRDLFLWSLFVNRSNLATCLCSRSENTIVAAMLACKIYQTAARSINESEKKAEYESKESEFDDHAAGIINKCFEKDEEFAVTILTSTSKQYFYYSPLQLAKESNGRKFLATKCMHKYLDKQWFGNINKHQYSSVWITILICILCIFPPLIPLIAWKSNILELRKEDNLSFNIKDNCFTRFFTQRAIVRFIYNILFYVAFLGLFSFIMLVDYFPINNNGGLRNQYAILIPVTEIILHICMWSIIIEECIEFRLYYIEKRSCNIDWAPQKYFTMDKWNILDLAAIFLYLAGFIPRWIPTEAAFTTSKVLMCIDLFLWYIRILHLFIASERLGTKLLMIFNTIKDLLFFICFVLIFLIGYSVASYSLITTNEQVFWNSGTQKNSTHTYELKQDGHGIWSWTIIRNVIDWGMWKVYGQVSILSNTQVDGSVLNGMIKHELLVSADELHIRVLLVDNGVYGTTVFILTILFVCIANVLLLNVLVALFNVTLKKVKDNAHMSWAFHRFLLVNEYARKSPFPPPFNLFEYGWRYINYLKSNKQLLNNNLHGSLDDSSGLDSNMYNIISFNAMDRVRMGGIVNQVFINFSTAPSTDDPDIRLFVIMDPTSASNSNWFRIVHHEHLVTKDPDLNIAGPTTAPKIKKEKGIQKFDTNIKINEGQYLAIRFSPKDGNPYSTIRNQYYVNYEDLPHANMSLLFTSCSTKGIAMSFNVKTAEDSYNKRCTLAPCCANNEQPPSYRNNVSGSIERNEFQSRDDMLREESIAQEYWATVIKGIKRSEKNENDQYKFETNNPKQLLEVTNHWADQKVEITI
ncbi:unnamed protein product [Rotaria socialis]|uniref:Uncharacterized protein n=1 Tax=Rotaria socialis TaxID=392032 RepID=A0A820P2I6_9BILA|nr:unnamed protein product [Rotaria socialis]